MGDRLARFGFTTNAGATVTPANIDVFLKDRIKQTFAEVNVAKRVKSEIGNAGLRPGPFGQLIPDTSVFGGFTTSGTSFSQRNASIQSIIKEEYNSRGLKSLPAGLTNPFNNSAVIQNVAGDSLGGRGYDDLFFDNAIGAIFGTGQRVGSKSKLTALFKDEKTALGAVDFIFKKDPTLRNTLFKASQDAANAAKKINDHKISGGPVGGVLKVATFGLGVSGALSGLGKSLGLVSNSQVALPGSAIAALKTTAGTIASTAGSTVVNSTVKKLKTPKSGNPGVTPGVSTGADQIAVAITNSGVKAGKATQDGLPAILSERSIARINTQRSSLGKTNLRIGKRKRVA